MIPSGREIRAIAQKLFKMDPYESMICGKCGEDVLVPVKASFSMCECTNILKGDECSESK